MNRKGVTLVEILAVSAWGIFIGLAVVGILMVVRNAYLQTSIKLEMQQQSRYGIDRVIEEIAKSAPAEVHIYKCPANVCVGGAVMFRVPVVTSDPPFAIDGSIFEPSASMTKPIKWGYDGLKTAEQIIYMVPAASGAFSAHQNKLIRLTRRAVVCPDGFCDPTENCTSCDLDCGTCWLRPFKSFNLAELWRPGIAYALPTIPNPPNISGYNDLPALQDPSVYNVRVLAADTEAIYFLGTPGPGTGGNVNSAPGFIEVYLKMARSSSIFGIESEAFLSSTITLRNLSF